MKITIFSDGGARGNPGPAAVGCVIQISNIKSQNHNAKCKNFEISKCIGNATNNQAEYRAVIEALRWVKENIAYGHSEYSEESVANATSGTSPEIPRLVPRNDNNLEIDFFLDSKLVVEQINQRYKLKNEGLKPLFYEIRQLMAELGGKISFNYISREKNTHADKLVNEALDSKK